MVWIKTGEVQAFSFIPGFQKDMLPEEGTFSFNSPHLKLQATSQATWA